MNDPVKIAADKIQPWIFGLSDSSQQARAALKALHDDGWRIVRTHHDGDLELPDDPDTALWIHVTEEWKP